MPFGGSAASDSELLDACRAGNTDAFAEVWERHHRAGRVAARGLAPSLDPDDLVSEAYLKIFELVQAGKGPRGAFRPYLYQTIRTIAVDRLRSPEQTGANLEELAGLSEAGPWEDNAFDLNATAEAFSSLSERWQSVLWYTEVEGLAPREVGAMLGMSANSVSALSGRAREALQSAWVEAHINRELADAECGWVLERVQRHQRGKLTARAQRQVDAHLASCTSCAAAARECRTLNDRLALVLATIFLGGGAAAALTRGGWGGASGGTAVGGGDGSGGTASGGGSTATASSAGSAASSSAASAAAISTTTGLSTGATVLTIAASTVVALAIAAGVAVAVNAAGANPAEADRGGTAIEQPAVAPDRRGGTDDRARAEAREREAELAEDADELGRADAVIEPINRPPAPRPPVVEPPGQPDPVDPVDPIDPVDPVDPNLDAALQPGFDCFYPGAAFDGIANEYGVLLLRLTPSGGTPVEVMQEIYDPAFEGTPGNVFTGGVFDDPWGNSFDFGFFTGAVQPDLEWWGPDPTTLPVWSTPEFSGLTIGDVLVEMRLVTPDGRYSPWMSLDLLGNPC